MKKITSLVLILLVAFTGVNAQNKSKSKSKGTAKEEQRASKHTTVSNDLISVTYGQPNKKGRVIFGEGGLVPFGQVWRTGADEATEITLKKGCMFAGRQVKAGTYTLFTTPFKGEWLIVLNSELGQWGAYGYDKVKDKNVLQSNALVETLPNEVETFTITPEKDGMRMSWDKTSVFIPIKPF